MNAKITFLLILLLGLVIFTVQNYAVVQIRFLFWGFETSRAIIIFVTLLVGFLIGWGLSVHKKKG
ncbi:MAG: LapA family protein [Candidatus Omnitrophica bacterium]|nr:LapA family protein [Candidatus Omnitrophota bacterium]